MSRKEDNIKVYLKEVSYEVLIWIQMRSGRDLYRPFVNAVMKLKCSVEYLEFHEYVRNRRLMKTDSVAKS